MRYVVFSFDGYGLPIADRLRREGREVEVGMVDDQADTVCRIEKNVPPEADAARERRLSLYDGMLKKRPAREVVESLRRAKNPEETFLFFDLNHLFRFSQELADLGFRGNFPTEDDYLCEIDREYAKNLVDREYPHVRVADKHRFRTAAEAKRFLKDSDEIWVLKGLAEDARTVVPDVDDLALAHDQIVDALSSNREEYESAGFILELLIPNALELTPERIYYDGEMVANSLCIENKPLGAGNVGPMTDCAQDLVFVTDAGDRINAMAFPPFVDALARERRGMFVWDASLLVDPRSGKVYFGEFCANRPGYNCLYSEMALAEGAGAFFEGIVQGKNPMPANAVAVSTRVFNLHQGEDGRPLRGARLGHRESAADDLWFTDLRQDRGQPATAGYKDTVAIATARGHSLGEAARRLQRTVDGLSCEGAYYRPPFDLVTRDYRTSIPNRLDYGLSRGWYRLGFGLG